MYLVSKLVRFYLFISIDFSFNKNSSRIAAPSPSFYICGQFVPGQHLNKIRKPYWAETETDNVMTAQRQRHTETLTYREKNNIK